MIDRSSSVPFYEQLKNILIAKIESGELQPGTKIETEDELSKLYGVSKIVIKQAVKDLVNQGLLYRERAKGTFVNIPKINKKLKGLSSFTMELQEKGYRPGIKLLSFKTIMPNSEVAATLQIKSGENVYRLERLRLADDVPMGLQVSYISCRLVPDFSGEILADNSLYSILGQKYAIQPVNASERYVCSLAESYEAKLLKIQKGDPVFRVERITYLENGRPFEFTLSTLRGDRYVLNVDLS